MNDPDLDAIYAGTRDWLKNAGDAAGLVDAQVIKADQPGTRPPPPFTTVKVILYDQKIGEDEEHVNDATPPQFRQKGVRTGTISVNAYGIGASLWLRRAVGRLRHPSVKAILTPAGLNLEPLGGMNNLTQVVDDNMEERFQRDFSVLYETVSDPEDVTELVQVETTKTQKSQAGDLVIVTTDTV